MTWTHFHRLSEELATRAHELRRHGHHEQSLEAFSKAADAEEQALECLDPALKPRTFSITAVSAAALRYKANELERASGLSRRALEVPSLDPFAVRELREILQLSGPAGEKTTDVSNRVRNRRTAYMALAASVLLAIVAGSFLMKHRGLFEESYTTQTGEMRTVSFSDGSVAYLNTRTQLRWMGSDQSRQVELLEGEALFDVKPEAGRSFSVMTDRSEIRVLGTRFNVYRKKTGDVVVTVLEGRVEVRGLDEDGRLSWNRNLASNERIEYQPIGVIQDVQETNALNAVKWRDGVLAIESEPLEDVLDELTRYTDHRIVIRDPRIAKMPIGGSLPTRDVRDALDRIAELEPSIRVEERDGQYTVSARTTP